MSGNRDLPAWWATGGASLEQHEVEGGLESPERRLQLRGCVQVGAWSHDAEDAGKPRYSSGILAGDPVDDSPAVDFEFIHEIPPPLPFEDRVRPAHRRQPLSQLLGELGRACGDGKLKSKHPPGNGSPC